MGFQIENGVLINHIEEYGVQEAVIPDTATSIGDSAFCNCNNIRKILISLSRSH